MRNRGRAETVCRRQFRTDHTSVGKGLPTTPSAVALRVAGGQLRRGDHHQISGNRKTQSIHDLLNMGLHRDVARRHPSQGSGSASGIRYLLEVLESAGAGFACAWCNLSDGRHYELDVRGDRPLVRSEGASISAGARQKDWIWGGETDDVNETARRGTYAGPVSSEGNPIADRPRPRRRSFPLGRPGR